MIMYENVIVKDIHHNTLECVIIKDIHHITLESYQKFPWRTWIQDSTNTWIICRKNMQHLLAM